MARPWGVLHGLGFALGLITLVAAVRAWRAGASSAVGVMLALSMQTAMFLASVAGTPALTRLRSVQVAALVAFLVILLSVLLIRRGRFAPGRAVLTASTAALVLLGLDTMLGWGAPNRVVVQRDWPDSSDAHPRLGRVPRPYSVLNTYYADDRNGYLLEEDLRAKTWEFSVMPGSAAELMLPKESPELLRVAIRKANRDTTWHVQLFHSRFAVQRRVPYFITFRARADGPRKISFGIAQHHPPWTDLGLYTTVDLTPKWKQFREVFQARRPDTNAMIVFHLAGSDIPVEIDSVTLHSPPTGQKVDPVVSTQRFFVRHQRNALGCRDIDYEVPRPSGTFRVLALGDGFTSGVGVHEPDAFPRLLERELNGQKTSREGYQVINCGMPGYGTREQRLFFELFGATYRPDLVLVTMRWNDDQYYWEERQRQSLQRGPSRLARLSSVLQRFQAIRRLRRTYDYSPSVAGLVALDSAARTLGARLVVAVSRDAPDGLGDLLLATLQKGLSGTKIPVLDLGTPPTTDSTRAGRPGVPGPDAHRVTALKLGAWLRDQGLSDPASAARIP